MKEFSLPKNAQTYINTVKDRCEDLIHHKIWGGIKILDLKRWFLNFDGELEQYFAACILDALIYRSDDQCTALANELFTKKLIKVLEGVGFKFESYKSLIELLKLNTTNELRLVSVSNKGERPDKSSSVILRSYRRKLGLNNNWFISPNEIDAAINMGITNFIFIDDFLGTGDQFNSMYSTYGFQLKLKDCNIFYAPLVAHSTGISNLKLANEMVTVVASEYLNEEFNVFNYAFEDGINGPECAKDFYNSFLNNKNFSDLPKENQYGFGNLGLAYAFSHSSPDNCLHIIWDDQNGWHPLIAK